MPQRRVEQFPGCRDLTFCLIAVLLIPAAATAGDIDFDRDVQPLLSAKCLKCHGNGTAEAELRFSERAAATRILPSGNVAVAPGRPEDSELLHRVAAVDESVRMPPEGDPLSADEVAVLRQWIAEGADWPDHWAYRPLIRPDVPDVPPDAGPADWNTSEIDRFILSELLARGLAPSPAADRRTLIRRVYYDLIGLPPAAGEVEAFVSDPDPLAYERIVERLLNSPRYGERWARHWMDIVHYAESHGHDQDRPRDNAWPYRDYLIASFNEDKPWSRFVQEQVAGDGLYPDDPQAIVATGLLATGPWDESSLRDIREDAPDREVARCIDRDDIVTTVMATFTSTTVHCARCHDHKFDPVSIRDYYALQAVFAATDKANRAYDPDPDVAARRRELQHQLKGLSEQVEQRDTQLRALLSTPEAHAWETELQAVLAHWSATPPVSVESGAGAELTILDDQSVLAGGTVPEKDMTTILVRPAASRVTGLRLEVLPHESLPMSGPGRAQNGNLHLSELRVFVQNADAPHAARELQVARAVADFNQDGWTIDHAIDGNPNTAWGIHPQEGHAHEAVFQLEEAAELAGEQVLRIELHQLHGGAHLIGRMRVSLTDRNGELDVPNRSISPELAEVFLIERSQRSEDQQLQLAEAFLRQRLMQELDSLPAQHFVYCGTNQFVADGSFRPTAEPRTIHVLHRGDVNQPQEEVLPGALHCLPGLAGDLAGENFDSDTGRRAALARWLTDPRNVLTWRSVVNRVWQYHFGEGLVDTPSDFGRMGGTPTHPQLLDWLAVEFRDSGGSLKSLHRRIVTSATWKQSVQHRDDFAAVDSENRLLWRMNRRRLDAESIRDSVLQLAGTLDLRMGGPSVKQFNQSPGIHVTPEVDYIGFDVDAPENRRRSVYRFVFRTLPDPFMEALDCPDASQLTPQRTSSLTALHALALLHDRTVVRQCEIMADNIAAQHGTPEQQLFAVYRLIFSREPSTQERQLVGDYIRDHGLANACRFLLNTNEFLFVE